MFGKKNVLKGIIVVAGIYALMAVTAISSLPENFRLIKNTKQKFNWSIPLKAEFYNESITVMSGKDSLNGEISLDLMDEFVVNTSEECITDIKLKLFGVFPVKTVSLSVIPEKKIVPSGEAVGVYMSTEGIMVLGTGKIDGNASPSDGILKSGDFILELNNNKLTDKEDLMEHLSESEGEEIEVLIYRDGAERSVKIKPVSSVEGEYKIGAWVRDSTQGIGTLTYYDLEDYSFGALGHGIYDADIDRLMPLREGSITEVSITGIRKGKSGNPGELMGIIKKDEVLGKIEKNTECGLYGVMNIIEESEALPIGLKQDVEEGEAFIISDAISGEREAYSVEIEYVNRYGSSPDKGMVLNVTDERLIDATNGIVQGMSGSPIIQNGKIIGAVTHVFVRNPHRGYGIFIESMLDEAE